MRSDDLHYRPTELAKRSKVGLSTIVDFEKSRRHVSDEVIKNIKAALEQAGIEFIVENGGGAGVRLRSRQRKRCPRSEVGWMSQRLSIPG